MYTAIIIRTGRRKRRMQDELTERVAKAIRRVVTTRDDWDAIGHVARQMYRREATAAIAVIEAYGNELIDDLLEDKLPSLSHRKSNH